MSRHDYSSRQALDLLALTLRDRNEDLGRQIQLAIDAGKDIEEGESRKAKGLRVYRKTVRFTDEEALQVALVALQAYFIEQPLFVRSASENFKAAIVGPPDDEMRSLWNDKRYVPIGQPEGWGDEKVLEVELQTETQISRTEEQTFQFKPVPEEMLDEQKAHVRRLSELFMFGDN
jgi:hypothetical protein